MGEYWKPVNVTRREWVHPHDFGDGLKLGEWTRDNSATMRVIRARWSPSDKIAIVSDYGRVSTLDGFESGTETAPEYEDINTFNRVLPPVPGSCGRRARSAFVQPLAIAARKAEAFLATAHTNAPGMAAEIRAELLAALEGE